VSAPTSTVDWKRCTSYVTLGIALYEDGTYTASLTSYYGEPRRWKRHTLAGGVQQFELAPAGLSALSEAAQAALDAFWAGHLD
jgi:hypothetical protein